MNSQSQGQFPGVLWVLPILFCVLGGVIGAIIAGTIYKANWWGLLLVGFVMLFIYFAIGVAIGMAGV